MTGISRTVDEPMVTAALPAESPTPEQRPRTGTTPYRVYILDEFAGDRPGYTHSQHYVPWLKELSLPWEVVDSYDHDWKPPSDAGVVVTIQHYRLPEVSILRRLTAENRVPVLIVADGILEYRNTWTHTDFPPATVFQPVLGHKVACLGRSQARMLESWGNLGKCEVVGAPRLDFLLGRRPRIRAPGEPFRFGVMTAKRPGFNEEQMAAVRASLRDLKAWFDQHRQVGDTQIETAWRLAAGLDQEIGVENRLADFDGGDLAGFLQHVDAVVTTPSTAMLEAMLHGLPVSLLDYNNCPHFVPAAWSITARDHIDSVLHELVAPPARRMLYQDTVLHDALECRTPAAPRMAQLVADIVRLAAECHVRGTPLVLAPRIANDDQFGFHYPEKRFDLRELFPEHPVFANLDRAALHSELAHAHHQLAQQVAQLARQQTQLDSVLNSRTWRIARRIHRVINRVWRIGKAS